MNRPRRFYEFGSFSIDLHSRILLREGRIVPLTPKAFETLVVLVEHRGEVVSRRDLIDAVWPDTHVVEGTLNSNIFSLRRVLGESRDSECFISTVPRRGYRFVAGVREVTWSADLQFTGARTFSSRDAGAWPADLRPTSERTLSNGHSKFCPEDSQAAGAPTSSNGDPATCSVDTLSAGERTLSNGDSGLYSTDSEATGALRFSNVHAGHSIWDSRATGARASSNGNTGVAAFAGPRSSPRGRCADADRSYLQGHYLLSRRTSRALHQAIECFNEATRLDPDHAAAQVGLAQCYSLLGCVHSATRPREAMPLAKSAALRALELDECSADAHAALGLVQTLYDWDWEGGERSYLQALVLNPDHVNAHHWYGLHLAWRGRQTEAEMELARARQLDPFSPIIAANVGWAHYAARHYDKAIEQLRGTVAISPTFYRAHVYLGWAYTQTGNFGAAFEHLQRGIELNGGGPEVAGLGYAYARASQAAGDGSLSVERIPREGLATEASSSGLEPESRAGLEREASLREAQSTLRAGVAREGGSSTKPAALPLLAAEVGSTGVEAPGINRAGGSLSTKLVSPESSKAAELTVRARSMVTELEERAQREYVSPYSIALVYAGLGERDQVLSWLERAYDDRTHWLVFLRVEPMFDSVRGDGRFERLLSRIEHHDLSVLPLHA